MQCVIYKGNKKADAYLFVEKEDDFDRVPAPLLSMLGNLEYVMSLELDVKLKLALVSAEELMKNMETEGFYLQLPPKDYIEGSVSPPTF